MTISPLDIEIKTINLKNKKLTKSIFNQIELKDCFNENLDFIGDKVFGYIKEKNSRYLLWSYKETLRKTCLFKHYNLRKIDSYSSYAYSDAEWFLKKCNIDYCAYDDSRGYPQIELENEEIIKYNALLDHLNEFTSKVLKCQLFI